MGYPKDDLQADLYDAEGGINEYSVDTGVCVLPLAEDPPTTQSELVDYSPVVVLRLHAAYRIRKYQHVAQKKNNPPPTPSYADVGAFVFLGGAVRITNSLNPTFRNYDWNIVCEYNYVEDCVCREQDGYMLGNPVWDWYTDAANQVQYGVSTPAVGAIAQGGITSLVGYRQGQQIVINAELVTGGNTVVDPETQSQANPLNGALQTSWGYNSPSYYPGTLILSQSINGGPPLV